MTTKNNKHETNGNGKALIHPVKKGAARAEQMTKANELTLRAWQKTYANRSKANKAA